METERRWPAEWEAHLATLMCWPVRHEIWPDGLDQARRAYAKVANTLVDFEPVMMLLPEEDMSQARGMLDGRIDLLPLPLNDSWARDTCPMFVVDGDELVGLDWCFNSWGGKFIPWDDDALLAARLLDAWQPLGKPIKREAHSMVLEGGAVHTNGQGCLMTTEECLLHPNRNPSLNREAIENTLLSAFAADNLLWLPYGIAGDVDTDGHVDNVACFLDAQTIVMQRPRPGDVDEERFESNRQAIDTWNHGQPRPFKLITLPMPETSWVAGSKVPRSYINFVWANGAVVVPQFGVDEDEAAVEFFQRHCPDREVIPLEASPIVKGGGGLHCITMQVPSTKRLPGNNGERS